jgi:hypothetical protein
VQHFEGSAELLDTFGKAAFNHAGGFHAQDGTEALATSENAMPHGFMNGSRVLRFGWEKALQRVIGCKAALFQGLLEHGS